MGEVYKARDNRLQRIVAIKILPSEDQDLKARFEREAKSIAALQDPHICTLHDVGSQDGTHYLVLEYLEGETLADRLRRGACPLEEALRHAIEIVGALDSAHRLGITHRDLKPANIMLTKDGVKLLDFGLAQLRSVDTGVVAGFSAAVTTSPQPMTAKGAIVGTLQYMSPEQLEGNPVDHRTDIWAFGCVLHEMLAGNRPFEGTSHASFIAAILEREPTPLATVRPLTPPLLIHIVTRCLSKNPETRWQSARDIQSELQWLAANRAPVAVAGAGAPRRRGLVLWAVAAAASIAVLSLAGSLLINRFADRQGATAVIRFGIPPPDGARFGSNRGAVAMASSVAVSPDGRRVAFVAETVDGRQSIWIRKVDGLAAEPLPGSDNGLSPFWSPDSRFLAFFAEGQLKKIEISGGPAQVVCETTAGIGGTWNNQGTIVFAAGAAPVLHQVPDGGGTPTAITSLDATRQETGHVWPSFLPDGKHFLYLSNAPQRINRSVLIGSLGSSSTTRLPSVHSRAVYGSPGILLFAIDTALMAQAFDLENFALTGPPMSVAQGVRMTDQTGYSVFSVSGNGVLAYQVGDVGFSTQLVWFDRTGTRLSALAPPGEYSNPSLSPDGMRVAAGVRDPQTMTRDIWVFDVTRGTASRLTFDASDDLNPAWSPDGTRVVFTSDRKGQRDIYAKAVNGIGQDELVFESSEQKSVNDWSADGRYVLYDSGAVGGLTTTSLSAIPLFGDRKSFPLVPGFVRFVASVARWEVGCVLVFRVRSIGSVCPGVSRVDGEMADLSEGRYRTVPGAAMVRSCSTSRTAPSCR